MENGILYTNNLPTYIQGPDISKGPLPAFFYFALSGEESLHLDPFNQPVVFLKDSSIRCFSFTLPFHGPGYDNQKGVERWEEELSINPDFLDIFFQQCLKNIDELIQQGYIDEEKIAIGGLSRGAFIATHLAARDPRLKYILGFAPMTRFPNHKKQDIESPWNLHNFIRHLVDKQVRFYIGNHDVRVGTQACFDFIHLLADASFHHGHRSPPVELIITPSVGFKGHGTLPPVFKAGADWIIKKLIFSESSE